jgi:hypothetical protein
VLIEGALSAALNAAPDELAVPMCGVEIEGKHGGSF